MAITYYFFNFKLVPLVACRETTLTEYIYKLIYKQNGVFYTL